MIIELENWYRVYGCKREVLDNDWAEKVKKDEEGDRSIGPIRKIVAKRAFVD